MKPTSVLKDITLIQLFERFATDDIARSHLESIRWADGIVCPKCGCKAQRQFSTIAANPAKKVRAGLRYCAECKSQFTVTIGTIFEDSHIPLRKWLIAFYMICSSKKGISSLQLQRNLDLGSYRSALFMAHRIRPALKSEVFASKLSGIVEADETFVGGFASGKGTGTTSGNKVPVFAMVQRRGPVRAKVLPTVNGANLHKAIRENIEICSEIHTDAYKPYKSLGPKYTHKSVKHSAGEFSRHEGENVVTTANVESFFSLLKRGIVGTFHHVSAQHLPLYLAEFEHRHNCRFITDGERTDCGLKMVEGKRLMDRK